MTFNAPGIDLHAHTTASDGTDSPAELIRLAAGLGLSTIAVTDHDTVAGLEQAQEAAAEQGIGFVPGVELSVEDDRGRFHMLGYLFDPRDSRLNETLLSLRASRAARNMQMADKMRDLGLPVTMDDVIAEAGDGGEVIARPHFARALMKKGIVNSVADAFDRYLSTGKPLYLPKEVLTPKDAIAMLHAAGGVAIMAHPGLISLNDRALSERIASLTSDDGLDGIEAYYSQHSEEQTQHFLEIARSNGLVVSGGSDYHGTVKPHVSLGIVYQGRPADPELLTRIQERREASLAAA